uniref:G_PROTEIN_RECEP_F1_2 domain-containing protein n=1 Tax=Heterorhabditis bacteriophora TaxID=37862 RepID=A0A1I7X9H9_HETBA
MEVQGYQELLSKMGCGRINEKPLPSTGYNMDHDQLRYSLLKGPYDIISFLLPVWAILYVFHTPNKFSSCYDRSTESIHSSHASTTAIADVVVVRNWRRRYRPLTQVLLFLLPCSYLHFLSIYLSKLTLLYKIVAIQSSLNDRPILSGHRSRQPGRLRAVSSAPLITSVRRMSVSRSLVSSPLYSIPEEMHQYEYEGPLTSIDVLSTDSLIGE